MTCCAYSWVSTVFLEILSFPFDSPSIAANYVVQLLWCPARVWRSYQVWWELVKWSKRWHMPNCEPMTVLSFPAKCQLLEAGSIGYCQKRSYEHVCGSSNVGKHSEIHTCSYKLIFLTKTDNTSKNNDLSSWITLYHTPNYYRSL
jgi:hypothetical protein